MDRDVGEHMIEEAHTGRDLVRPAAVKVQPHMDVGLAGGSVDFGGSHILFLAVQDSMNIVVLLCHVERSETSQGLCCTSPSHDEMLPGACPEALEGVSMTMVSSFVSLRSYSLQSWTSR